MAKLELPDNIDLAKQIVDHDARARERGAMGRLLGSRENAPVYIAGVLAFLCVVAIIGLVYVPGEASELRGDVVKALAGIGLAALGYLFGSR